MEVDTVMLGGVRPLYTLEIRSKRVATSWQSVKLSPNFPSAVNSEADESMDMKYEVRGRLPRSVKLEHTDKWSKTDLVKHSVLFKPLASPYYLNLTTRGSYASFHTLLTCISSYLLI